MFNCIENFIGWKLHTYNRILCCNDAHLAKGSKLKLMIFLIFLSQLSKVRSNFNEVTYISPSLIHTYIQSKREDWFLQKEKFFETIQANWKMDYPSLQNDAFRFMLPYLSHVLETDNNFTYVDVNGCFSITKIWNTFCCTYCNTKFMSHWLLKS